MCLTSQYGKRQGRTTGLVFLVVRSYVCVVVGSVIPPHGVEDVNKPIYDGDDRLLVRLAFVSMLLIDGMEVVIVANGNLTG